MRVLDQYVLVEQIMTSKSSKIILDTAKQDKDKFNFSYKVLQLGAKCERDIKVGESPVFSQHVTFPGLRIVEKSLVGVIAEIVIHEGDIIGVDEDVEVSNQHEEMRKKIIDSLPKKDEALIKPINNEKSN